MAPCAPILACSQIEWHMRQILWLSRELLANGVAGVLLFFPLRVAGARVRDAHHMHEVLDLFRSVLQRGYAVADAMIADLSELWSNTATT